MVVNVRYSYVMSSFFFHTATYQRFLHGTIAPAGRSKARVLAALHTTYKQYIYIYSAGAWMELKFVGCTTLPELHANLFSHHACPLEGAGFVVIDETSGRADV